MFILNTFIWLIDWLNLRPHHLLSKWEYSVMKNIYRLLGILFSFFNRIFYYISCTFFQISFGLRPASKRQRTTEKISKERVTGNDTSGTVPIVKPKQRKLTLVRDKGHLDLTSNLNYRWIPSYLFCTLLLFPFHVLPSPVHPTGLSLFLPWLPCHFYLLSSNNNNRE